MLLLFEVSKEQLFLAHQSSLQKVEKTTDITVKK